MELLKSCFPVWEIFLFHPSEVPSRSANRMSSLERRESNARIKLVTSCFLKSPSAVTTRGSPCTFFLRQGYQPALEIGCLAGAGVNCWQRSSRPVW